MALDLFMIPTPFIADCSISKIIALIVDKVLVLICKYGYSCFNL